MFRKSSGPEDLLQFVGLGDFQLIVAAVTRLLVGPPAQEHRRVTEAVALEVVVLDLAHALDTHRPPRHILAGAPAALPARHATRLAGGGGPVAPGMVLQGVLAQRGELLYEQIGRASCRGR